MEVCCCLLDTHKFLHLQLLLLKYSVLNPLASNLFCTNYQQTRITFPFFSASHSINKFNKTYNINTQINQSSSSTRCVPCQYHSQYLLMKLEQILWSWMRPAIAIYTLTSLLCHFAVFLEWGSISAIAVSRDAIQILSHQASAQNFTKKIVFHPFWWQQIS